MRSEPGHKALTIQRHLPPKITAQAARIRAAGRKGWLPAFRDAVLFKVAYAFGLRRNETRMLDVTDFGRNPHADEFGAHGVC